MVSANEAWNLCNFREGLIRALVGRGLRVLAVAPPDPVHEARLRALGCEFAPVRIDSMGISPRRDLRCLLDYLRLMRRHRPAALLGWTIKPNVYGSLAAGLCGVPALPNISGLGTAFIRRNLLTRVVTALYRTALRRAPVVFFQNADDRAVFVEGGMVRAGQARLLAGSGVDTAYWAPPPGPRPARGHFLMIARVVADKGVREFVDAARIVRQTSPQARFTLLGPVDVANRTAIPRAEIAGWVDEGLIELHPPLDDVRPAIAGADFVVLPSYREGLSRVLLEASAMARPIVTTDVPGCRDVVREGENGFLCAARDGAALAAAMERALALDDDRWAAMGAAGRARVKREFAVSAVTSAYLDALVLAGAIPPLAA
jgi:glycosyltransferase involved in cell wall biosynthesis